MNDMNDTPDDNTPSGREPWEDEMTSEFDRRVRDLHEAPLTLGTVKGKAMNIQRRRRAAVAGGILAAAAVIVPVAVLAIDPDGDAAPDPVQPATTATTATESPTPSPTEEPTPLAPAYVEGTTYHRSDGSVFELPSASYEFAATLGDRVVAARTDDQGNVVVEVLEGDSVEAYRAGSYPVSSEAGETVAFVTADGEVQTIWADGDAVLADGYGGWSVSAVAGGPDCLDPEAGNAGCRVFLRDNVSTRPPTAVDSHGLEGAPVPGATMIFDADDRGRLSVITSATDDGSCGGVYDEGAGSQLFETCEFAVKDFSPDGSLVTGAPAYGDGFGDGFAAILDATTGRELARFEPGGGSAIVRTAWVDDETLAAQVRDPAAQTWAIWTLRVGEDPVVAVGPVKSEVDFPAALALAD